VYRRRSLIFGLIAVVAGVVVLVTKPLTVSTIGWTAFWAAVAVVVVTLVERPAHPIASAAPVQAGTVDSGQVAH
jgi:hypothetical protein